METQEIDALEAFLSCSTDKTLLASYVANLVRRHQARSILDIGAGDGTMVWNVMASCVTDPIRYTAVERSPRYAKRLREMGIEVVEGEFPCLVGGTYDIVLAAHSLPPERDGIVAFLDAAEELLSPSGRLVVVAHDEGLCGWKNLAYRAGIEERPTGRSESDLLRGELARRFRKHSAMLRPAHLSSDDFDLFLAALAYIVCDGDADRVQAFVGSDEIRREAAHFYRPGSRLPIGHHVYVAER